MFKKLLLVAYVCAGVTAMATNPFIQPKFQRPGRPTEPRIKVACPTRPPTPSPEKKPNDNIR